MDYQQPSPVQIGISMSAWLLTLVGALVVRMELHPWVNTVMLTIVFPFFTWFMARNSILGSVSQRAMFTTVVAAGLFMTLLLEAQRNGSFSKELKKNLKAFGREPSPTAIASVAIAGSLLVGMGLSYLMNGPNFIEA